MNVYLISTRISDYLDAVSAVSEGEIGQSEELALDALGMDYDEAVDEAAKAIRNSECRIAALKAEIDRLKSATEDENKRVAGMQKAVLDSLKRLGLKAAGKTFKVSRQNNPPSVEITDAEAVSEAYKTGELSGTMSADDLHMLVSQCPELAPYARVLPSKKAALDEWKSTGTAPAGFDIKQKERLVIK